MSWFLNDTCFSFIDGYDDYCTNIITKMINFNNQLDTYNYNSY